MDQGTSRPMERIYRLEEKMLTIKQLISELLLESLQTGAVRTILLHNNLLSKLTDKFPANVPQVPQAAPATNNPKPSRRRKSRRDLVTEAQLRECFANRDSYYYPQPFKQTAHRQG